MPIISAEILKIIDERGRCDTRCVVMTWSSSEVWLRQLKMSIISVKENKHERWKRNAKTTTKKGHTMIETRHLKNVVIFFETNIL